MGCRELQYYFNNGANPDYHRASGTIPNRFVFRFSSEYHDSETNLVYYNYRYYSPELGRWLSRDPIGENGGWNLYVMVGNNPVGRWDYLGLKISWWECSGLCASYALKQAWKAVLALETIVATAEGLMELPLKLKAINMGTERLTSLGNTLYKTLNTLSQNPKLPNAVTSLLSKIAGWAKTSGTFLKLPGIRSKIKVIKRFAKGGRTLLRIARGGVVAGGVVAVAIESYCLTSCCSKSTQDFFENELNTNPGDFL